MSDLITLEPDPNIEPGHQWIVMPLNPDSIALAQLLTGGDIDSTRKEDGSLEFRIPHNAAVDTEIVALINRLAHVRFSAPGLVQLTLETPG